MIFPLIVFLLLLGSVMVHWGPEESLDAKLYYTGEQARALLSSMSDIESRKYFVTECLDLLFLTTYSALSLAAFTQVFAHKRSLIFVPLLPGCFDLVETSSILYALRTQGSHDFLNWLGVVTFLKWGTGLIVLLIILGGYGRKRSAKH